MLIILMILMVNFMQVSTYDPPYESIDFRNNQFKFNPGPPRRKVRNKFNFKPPLPSDLSKIYISEKFLPPDSEKNQSDYLNLPLAISSRLTGEPNALQKNSGAVPFDEICGKPLSTNPLIINGSRIPKGAYPWLAAIFGVKAIGLNYLCTASLISNLHVVTAAHCVQAENRRLRPEDVLVILGKLNIQKWVPTEGERIVELSRIHVHPDYDPSSSDADIAVLVLSEKIRFTRFIRPICLWRGSTDLNEIVGKEGTVVGWGKNEDGLLMTAEPKQIKLPIVNQEQCLRSSYQFQYITSNRTFCAGNRNGSGPCNGDSGSGFIMKIGQKWSLRGVVSMAISDSHSRTCDLSNYVVFTDASKFSTWLLSFVR